MPNGQELSGAAVTPHHLQEFILSHSIPTALNFGHLLHFPNGSLVPSSTPSKIISVTHSRRSGLFLNNAKIVTPNVLNLTHQSPCSESMVSSKRDDEASPASDLKKSPTLH
ncbi:unnamed protein product [Prunus armeniaca]|uniref:FAS1 domain-containing protein n=1 Tax=Prunus armeniaca TaxID=36596 RepID=A0A6J5WWZ7_PRUAR|nr:unnamed protein product [Prunus armeniaca]CAB4304951.1 unnamed protein product [Prunus armeniaca]